jgi:hypothetical protein
MQNMTPMDKARRRISAPDRALAEFRSRAALTDKQVEVLTRRRAGETFTSIATHFGVTPPAIRTIYLVAEKKDAELKRTICCPHCSGAISLYDALDL